jgi:hypothetical protein
MRFLLALFGTAAALSGCVGVDTMRTLAPDEGVEVRHALPADSVLDALPGALAGRGLRVRVRDPSDSSTTVIIAKKGSGPFGNGELVRVRVRRPAAGDLTSARFVARSHDALELSGRVDRVVLRVIQALDDSLGPAALGPFPGMRVRGRSGGDRESFLHGTVMVGADSTRGRPGGHGDRRRDPNRGLERDRHRKPLGKLCPSALTWHSGAPRGRRVNSPLGTSR